MQPMQEGGCQCGALRYEIDARPIRIGVCFCSECQRHSGSAFSLSVILSESAFRLTKGTTRQFVRKADSGRSVACIFCPECGTRIFHKPEFLPGLINLKPGTLDDPSWVAPTVEVFAARRPAWLSLRGIEVSHDYQIA